MTIPIINTSATNLELTNELQSLISKKIAPLGRLLVHEREVKIDLSIRRIDSIVGADSYYVSAKLSTDKGNYNVATSGYYLNRVLLSLQESLRRAVSKGASVETYKFAPVRRDHLEAFTLTL